jgi:hypothetical protein
VACAVVLGFERLHGIVPPLLIDSNV